MELPALSLNEWLVLALIAEEPTHGFAIARLTSAAGPLGTIWQIPKPLVYRAIGRLAELGLIRHEAIEPSTTGPQRALVAATDTGRAAMAAWLVTPVEHIRDVRSELLLKLALLDRAGLDPGPLIEAQRARIDPLIAALRQRHEKATGFDRTLTAWRHESAQTVLRFLTILQTPPAPSP
ncbi:PadR family transcriptional regulator [Streptosporangiaceae bacterium NEAU-GS5]|nr:PadR family transcriptional regulator [Streptosporangiaceae bacterium NEAU-GS5]